jgi:ribosomal protein S18 acetylase RimI-like enzyme
MPALEGMSFDHVLLTTRAVRKRLDLHRPVQMEVLRECFELAQQAPTQSDTQGFHIMTVGVLPERQGKGIGKKLMAKALEIVDANHKECYLETQNKTNVPIYQKLGFEVVSDKEIPTGGLHNWGMLRQKR